MGKTVQEMIASGESEELEFKTTFSKEAIESISALANHKGGVVLIGVQDSGKVIGITSRTRNKLIAEAFYLTGDIEKYGSGFIRIRKEIKSYPTMTFTYEESGDAFLASLSYQEQKISSAISSPEEINEGVNRLLQHIQNDPGKQVPQISQNIEIPIKTVERWVADLKKQNIIECRGSKKSGGYHTIPNE